MFMTVVYTICIFSVVTFFVMLVPFIIDFLKEKYQGLVDE